MKDVYSNRSPAQWLLLCANIEHADPGERFEEDFADMFGEDFLSDDERDEPEGHISEQTGFYD